MFFFSNRTSEFHAHSSLLLFSTEWNTRLKIEWPNEFEKISMNYFRKNADRCQWHTKNKLYSCCVDCRGRKKDRIQKTNAEHMRLASLRGTACANDFNQSSQHRKAIDMFNTYSLPFILFHIILYWTHRYVALTFLRQRLLIQNFILILFLFSRRLCVAQLRAPDSRAVYIHIYIYIYSELSSRASLRLRISHAIFYGYVF